MPARLHSQALSALVGLTRFICVAIGVFSLFGSLFVGVINFDTLAGVCLILVGIIPRRQARGGRVRNNATLIWWLSVAGLLLTLGGVGQYYAFYHGPGNYYPWEFGAIRIAVFSIMAIVSRFIWLRPEWTPD